METDILPIQDIARAYAIADGITALKAAISELDCLGEHDLAQACIDALDTWEGDQGK